MPATIRNPLFARLFDRVLSPQIEREAGDARRELVAGLSGRVLEIGSGNGANLRRYGGEVTEVVALEPEPYLREKASAAAAAAPVPVTVRDAVAEAVPEPDGSFDAAVASLVLCSVADQAAVLAELRRVLRAGGQLRFFEHVRADGGVKAAAQVLLDRSGTWPLVGGGCHCSRRTVAAIVDAGFQVLELRRLTVGPGWAPSNPMVVGRARLAR